MDRESASAVADAVAQERQPDCGDTVADGVVARARVWWRRCRGDQRAVAATDGAAARSGRPDGRSSLLDLVSDMVSMAVVASIAVMAWKLAILWTFSESPIVVVLSGSMEPGIYRGDLLLLNNRTTAKTPLSTGDIVVYNLRERTVPIVHRIISVRERSPAEVGEAADDHDGRGVCQFLLTKGDNNLGDDRGLYARGQMWLRRRDIVGRVTFIIPKVGFFTILLNAWPWAKYVIIGALSIAVILTSR